MYVWNTATEFARPEVVHGQSETRKPVIEISGVFLGFFLFVCLFVYVTLQRYRRNNLQIKS